MKGKVITLVVLAAIVWAGKTYLENQAERMVGVAEEMYEDRQYDKALRQLRDADKYLGWTAAVKESEELREKVRKRLDAQRQQNADEIEARRLQANWENQRRQEQEELAREEESKRREEARRELQERSSRAAPPRR